MVNIRSESKISFLLVVLFFAWLVPGGASAQGYVNCTSINGAMLTPKHDASSQKRCDKYVAENYLLATLSALSYKSYDRGDVLLVIGDSRYVVEEVFPSDQDRAYGLAFMAISEQRTDDRKIARVGFVYRGTENLKDWVFGNLPLIRTQYRIALERTRSVLNQDRFISAGTKSGPGLFLTGHSLGGGIALSIWGYLHGSRPGIIAVGFNASPHFSCRMGSKRDCRREFAKLVPDSSWRVVYETGDPTRAVGNLLFPLRWNWLSRLLGASDRNHNFHRVNYMGPSLISDHEMLALACHLLESATYLEKHRESAHFLRKQLLDFYLDGKRDGLVRNIDLPCYLRLSSTASQTAIE